MTFYRDVILMDAMTSQQVIPNLQAVNHTPLHSDWLVFEHSDWYIFEPTYKGRNKTKHDVSQKPQLQGRL